jgi:hypothetical protein
MNSIKAISISTLNDDKSQSVAGSHNSWKIEKFTDNLGKLNYKIRTDKIKPSKTKTSSHYNAMPAYGVPGAKSYQTKNVPTLNSSIIKYSPIKQYKKKKSINTVMTTPTKNVLTSDIMIKKSLEISNSSDDKQIISQISNLKYFILERNLLTGIKSNSPNNYIINQNNLLSYKDEKDLVNKCLILGHYFNNPITISDFNLIFTFDNSLIENKFKISIWKQNVDTDEIFNIYNLDLKSEISKNKLIINRTKLDIYVENNSNLLITFHCDNFKNNFGIKYNLIGNFNDLIINQTNNELKDSTSVSTLTTNTKPVSVIENQNPISIKSDDIPKLSNDTIFGNVDFNAQVPIFKKSKDKSIINDSSNFSLLQGSLNVFHKKKEKSDSVMDDSSHNTENDLKNILDILRELK